MADTEILLGEAQDHYGMWIDGKYHIVRIGDTTEDGKCFHVDVCRSFGKWVRLLAPIPIEYMPNLQNGEAMSVIPVSINRARKTRLRRGRSKR